MSDDHPARDTIDELIDELIDAVRRVDPAVAPMLDSGHSVTTHRLQPSGVHRGVEFVRLEVRLAHPGPSFVCAWTPDGVVVLRNPESMVELNRRVGLRLESPDQLAAYLRTWFALVDPTRGVVVETPDELPWSPSLLDLPGSSEDVAQASALVHPIRIEGSGDGRFRVVVSVLQRRTLQSRVLDVDAEGAVRIVASTDLLDELPVRATIR